MISEEKFLQRYNGLNAAQRLAVDTLEGPVLVVAGPGSGKTELLGLRVANILRQLDVYPGNILCLTFTDAAAINMRERLVGLIGQDAYKVAIHTFHSFGTEVINRYPHYFYRGAVFQPADDLVQIEVLEQILGKLPYDSPLAGKHGEAYTYLTACRGAISDLKRAGLTPQDFLTVVEGNAECLAGMVTDVDRVFGATVTKAMLAEAEDLISRRHVDTSTRRLVEGVRGIDEVLLESLVVAVAQCQAEGKTSGLTAWKSKCTSKDGDGRVVLRDWLQVEKMRALAGVYDEYRRLMHEHKYFDFDDMLLDVVAALEENSELQYELQEQFQYVLVDEFQDTNDAQMRLLHLVTDAPVYEGRPNVLAVGDDDQAIYKFQGAEVANIQQFGSRYLDPSIVVLTHNYRSTQPILDVARQVILQGEERLENLVEEIRKDLVAANSTLLPGRIDYHIYATQEHEFLSVAKRIQAMTDDGVRPEEMAVICRQHRDLEKMAGYLGQLGVPVRYERQSNVLQEPHIRQLIQIGRYIASLCRKREAEADELLPEILSYPFWQIDRLTLWRLAVAARNRPDGLWLAQMQEGGDEKLQAIAEWLLELRERSAHESLERILERLIGVEMLPFDEDGEGGEAMSNWQLAIGNEFVSPFKEFYFSAERLKDYKSEYVAFLSSLKTFVQAMREYRQGQPVNLDDMLTFVDIHEKNGLPVTDTSAYASGMQAVQLMTAHKAKGLEFETVFVLSCQDEVWRGSGRSSLLPFPMNLPITSAADTLDDQLRLFYVALTRARRNLYLSGYKYRENGKESVQLQFLAGLDVEEIGQTEFKLEDPAEVLASTWQTYHRPPIVGEEKSLLLPLVERYQLSVTGLNDFLDVSKGGPQAFLEHHLLRFPEAKSLAQSYGIAVHEAVRELYLRFRTDGVLPDVEFMLGAFERALVGERLSEGDFKRLLEQGHEEVRLYYESTRFDPTDEVERNFAGQQVMVGEACLTGKIDRMVWTDRHTVEVHDIKTGRPKLSWTGKDAQERLTLHRYERQLLFYKLLVERSRDYGHRATVKRGVLEFVKPGNDGQYKMLEKGLTDEDAEGLVKLIEVVSGKIRRLEFPDVSGYSPDLKGMEQFERDLLEGKV